jgi:protein SCO1
MRPARFLALALASLAALFLLSRLSRPGMSGAEGSFQDLPDFRAVNAWDGGDVGLTDLKGRPWVAGFLFTRCAGPCPLIASRMSALQAELPSEVRLVTFTVDPEYDTPSVLRGYAARFRADPSRWWFLRADVATLYKLLYEGFHLPLAVDPSAPAPSRATHSARLVLVDGRGRPRGLYDSSDEDLANKLKRALGGLS